MKGQKGVISRHVEAGIICMLCFFLDRKKLHLTVKYFSYVNCHWVEANSGSCILIKAYHSFLMLHMTNDYFGLLWVYKIIGTRDSGEWSRKSLLENPCCSIQDKQVCTLVSQLLSCWCILITCSSILRRYVEYIFCALIELNAIVLIVVALNIFL